MGCVSLPLVLHEKQKLMLLALGRVEAQRPAYHADGFIYPIGYSVRTCMHVCMNMIT